MTAGGSWSLCLGFIRPCRAVPEWRLTSGSTRLCAAGVVGLREVYEDDEELHLVMELCMGGDWFERLITYGRCALWLAGGLYSSLRAWPH